MKRVFSRGSVESSATTTSPGLSSNEEEIESGRSSDAQASNRKDQDKNLAPKKLQRLRTQSDGRAQATPDQKTASVVKSATDADKCVKKSRTNRSSTAYNPKDKQDPDLLSPAETRTSRSPAVGPLKGDDVSGLQCIEGHRIVISENFQRIELCCRLENDTRAWILESVVQRASDAAVCTYWGCGPEEWKRPGLDQISKQPLKILAYGETGKKLHLQMVGYPASRGEWVPADCVKEHWGAFYDECYDPSAASAQINTEIAGQNANMKRELETIVGHRKEEDEDGNFKYQLSCQWLSGPESWENDEYVRRDYNAAVLTYWASELDARDAKHLAHGTLTKNRKTSSANLPSRNLLLSDQKIVSKTRSSPKRKRNFIAPDSNQTAKRRRRLEPNVSQLQSITAHKIENAGQTPYIALYCHLADDTKAWIRESTVQNASNAAVCTYWGCGPEEWKRPGPDQIPPEPLKVLGCDKTGEKLHLQMTGYPVTRGEWMSVKHVKNRWKAFYENWVMDPSTTSMQATPDPGAPEAMQRGDLQTIVGHRLEEDNGDFEFQFSCQWESGPETWEYEEDIQRNYNAAVLTYWASDPKARKGKVKERYLHFLSHTTARGELFLQVQWLGSSASSKHTTYVKFCDARENWESGYNQYLKDHNLATNSPSTT